MKEIYKALATVQAQLTAATKSSENAHYRNKYADLAEVWNVWKAVGPSNGLALIQTTRYEHGITLLVTTLAHESGETITSEYPLLPTKQDPQGYGSAMTYARRYCLAAMVGITQEDDDGNGGSGVGNRDTPPPPPPAPPPAPKATPKQDRVQADTKTGVDAWIDRANQEIDALPTAEAWMAWQKKNQKALEKLSGEYPDKHQDLMSKLDEAFVKLDKQRGKAA